MSSLQEKFSRACKLIPREENLQNQRFILYKGNLYFRGDKAGFIIDNFIDTEATGSLTYQDISNLEVLEGEVSANREDEFMVRFSDASQQWDIHCTVVEEEPEVTRLPVHKYGTMTNVFTMGKGMIGLRDMHTTIAALQHEDNGYMMMTSKVGMAAVKGEETASINVGKIPEVIDAAVTQGARVAYEKNIMRFMIDDTDYKIFSEVKFTKSIFPQKAIDVALKAFSGGFSESGSDDYIATFTAALTDIKKLASVTDKMAFNGIATCNVTEGTFHLEAKEQFGRVYRNNIPVEMGEKPAVFKCRVPSGKVINFLANSVESKDKDTAIQFTVNMNKNLMIMQPVVSGERRDNAIMVTRISS